MNTLKRLDDYLAVWEQYLDLNRRGLEYAKYFSKAKVTIGLEQGDYSLDKTRSLQQQCLRRELVTNPTKLIEFGQGSLTKYCYSTYFDQGIAPKNHSWPRKAFLSIPHNIIEWFASSKKAYHLSDSLKMLLDHTDIAEMNLHDIKFPFNTFAITLDTPTTVSISSDIPLRIDTILFLKIQTHDRSTGYTSMRLKIVLLGENQQNSLRWFTDHEREIAKAERSKDSVLPYFDLFDSWRKQNLFPTLDIEIGSGNVSAPISEIIKVAKEVLPVSPEVILLPIKIALYLMTLKSPPVSQNIKNDFGLKKHVIKQIPFDCFELDHTYNVSPSEMSNLGLLRTMKSNNSTLCPHFRRGHLRRKPGTANDPNAIKMVWVRPTFVNSQLKKITHVVASQANIR